MGNLFGPAADTVCVLHCLRPSRGNVTFKETFRAAAQMAIAERGRGFEIEICQDLRPPLRAGHPERIAEFMLDTLTHHELWPYFTKVSGDPKWEALGEQWGKATKFLELGHLTIEAFRFWRNVAGAPEAKAA